MKKATFLGFEKKEEKRERDCRYTHTDSAPLHEEEKEECYGEICNHHRNSLNEELGHRSPDRHTRRYTERHPGQNT